MTANITTLPVELILNIIRSLDYQGEISALSRTSRSLHHRLTPLLYKGILLRHGPILYIPTNIPKTILRWAAANGMESTAIRALDAGAQPEPEPAILAAIYGHDNMIKLLHDRGFEIDSDRYSKGEDYDERPAACHYAGTPSFFAAQEGHESVVRLLLSYGVRLKHYKSPLLRSAAWRGHLAVVNVLLDAGCEIDERDYEKMTALHVAVINGESSVVQLLLERGADPNVRDRSGQAPIISAVQAGHIECARSLLEHGSRPPALEVISEPIERHRPAVIKLLMDWEDYGETSQAQREHSMLACLAAECGFHTLLEYYISRGWDVIDGPARRWAGTRPISATPLALAAENGHLETVQFLLSRGANPCGQKDREDEERPVLDPLAAAVQNGHEKVVALLLEHGSDPNAMDLLAGRPLLFQAVPFEPVFKLLVAHGADVTTEATGLFAKVRITTHVLRSGTAGEVQMLLDKGVDFNHTPIQYPAMHSPYGTTDLDPLEILAESTEGIINTLLQNGYDPQPGGLNEQGGLSRAALFGNLPLLRLLIDRGFNIWHPEWQAGFLLQAASARDPEVAGATVDFLLEQGLDIESRNEDGNTVLIQAIYACQAFNYPQAALLLIEQGANPVAQSDSGEYPLVAAKAPHTNYETVKALLKAIDERGIPFAELEDMLLGAIKGGNYHPSQKETMMALRHYYWRRRHPVPGSTLPDSRNGR